MRFLLESVFILGSSRIFSGRHIVREKSSPKRNLSCWVAESFTKNHLEVYRMLTQERQQNPPTNPRKLCWASFPFTITGSDEFGPIEINFLRRTLKRWCCLLICFTTRAEHIEVSQSTDTESCLARVTRFIATRGYPNSSISEMQEILSEQLTSVKNSWTSGTQLRSRVT